MFLICPTGRPELTVGMESSHCHGNERLLENVICITELESAFYLDFLERFY